MNKVLIIDDDKELCALMKKCIEQEKLSAVTVYNGIEGVRLIDENKDSYSLIILDVMLPDIDGFQILQKIRDTSNIPVLMLTAKSGISTHSPFTKIFKTAHNIQQAMVPKAQPIGIAVLHQFNASSRTKRMICCLLAPIQRILSLIHI